MGCLPLRLLLGPWNLCDIFLLFENENLARILGSIPWSLVFIFGDCNRNFRKYLVVGKHRKQIVRDKVLPSAPAEG